MTSRKRPPASARPADQRRGQNDLYLSQLHVVRNTSPIGRASLEINGFGPVVRHVTTPLDGFIDQPGVARKP
jgi:hypothetical protein